MKSTLLYSEDRQYNQLCTFSLVGLFRVKHAGIAYMLVSTMEIYNVQLAAEGMSEKV